MQEHNKEKIWLTRLKLATLLVGVTVVTWALYPPALIALFLVALPVYWYVNPHFKRLANNGDTSRVLNAHAGMASPDVWKAHEEWKKQMDQNYEAFQAVLPGLRARHRDKFVSIQDGRVIAIADTSEGAQTGLDMNRPYMIGPTSLEDE